MKLNSKQENFCNEYIKNGANGTQAYLKAYKTKNEETATVNASRLLRNANVQQYISELQEKARDEAIMSAIERKKWLTDVVKDIQREECMLKMPDGEEMVIGSKNADLNTKLKACLLYTSCCKLPYTHSSLSNLLPLNNISLFISYSFGIS